MNQKLLNNIQLLDLVRNGSYSAEDLIEAIEGELDNSTVINLYNKLKLR